MENAVRNIDDSCDEYSEDDDGSVYQGYIEHKPDLNDPTVESKSQSHSDDANCTNSLNESH